MQVASIALLSAESARDSSLISITGAGVERRLRHVESGVRFHSGGRRHLYDLLDPWFNGSFAKLERFSEAYDQNGAACLRDCTDILA